MRWFAIAVSAFIAALAGAPAMAADRAAPAGPQRTAWSTYLRSGPGETYPVLDELEHDTLVTVGGCDNRWCRVTEGSIAGYVDRDAVTLPRPALAAAAAGAQTCFVADQAGYRRPAPTRFCQPQPMGASAAH